jgi:hypothetical protein
MIEDLVITEGLDDEIDTTFGGSGGSKRDVNGEHVLSETTSKFNKLVSESFTCQRECVRGKDEEHMEQRHNNWFYEECRVVYVVVTSERHQLYISWVVT